MGVVGAGRGGMTALAWVLPPAGLAVGCGVALLVLGRGAPAEQGRPKPAPRRLQLAPAAWGSEPRLVRWASVAMAALAMLAATRWVVAALGVAALVWVAPRLLGDERRRRRQLEVLEALASWIEMMRDSLGAMGGLETAIAQTAPRAPLAIRWEVQRLAAELHTAEDLDRALLRFAHRIRNEVGDRVVAGLRMQRGHATLGEVLGAIARQTRALVEVRRRNEVEQQRLRRSARWIVGFSLLTVVVVALADRSFLSPYDSRWGQVVLGVVLLIWGAGYGWLVQLSSEPPGIRLFLEEDAR